MKKTIIIFSILLISLNLFSGDVYNELYYTRLTSEPVKWNPESGIYNDNINLTITSDYGKIYYLINSNFNEREPLEYNKKIILKESSGGIAYYNVLAIIEKEDGSLEFYSRVYRIDKTNKFTKNIIQAEENNNVKKEVLYEGNVIKFNFEFPTNEYDISYQVREFNFQQNVKKNESNKKQIILTKAKDKESLYLINLTYIKDNKIYSEVLNYSFNQDITYPPGLGSLYWGQVYKQGYKIKIKPDKPEDKVFYWINEWNKDKLILGPPDQSNKEKWILYTDQIPLNTIYGKDGITGIAAFSEGKNGVNSVITGPYYFKINGINNTIEQVFTEDNKEEQLQENIYINDKKYTASLKDDVQNIDAIYYSNVILRFENFNKDDRFYFTYKSRNISGKSELFPCLDEFNFLNNDKEPVTYSIFSSNGEKIAGFIIYGSNMILPVLKSYNNNYIDLSGDAVVDFYMPLNQVRYDYTFDENKTINITKDSVLFTGKIKITSENKEKKILKLKFRAFDKENNALEESDYYYFNIDNEKPNKDVEIEGADIKIYHNENKKIALIPPGDNLNVYYKLTDNSEWILYDKPIEFIPPVNGKYYVKLYVKSKDEAGNERENAAPYDLLFDTRGIFVDYNYKYNGNGTESSPCNSLEKAVKLANIKDIKNIYMLSNEITISEPIEINSDIIIQPYNINNKPVIHLKSKSLWRKNLIWFDVKNKGYLELRNINFLTESGGLFANINNCKIKMYNTNIDCISKDDFSLINNNYGKIGINNINIKSVDVINNFNFIKTDNGSNVLKNIMFDINAVKLKLFDISNTKYFELNNMKINISINESSQFADIKNSNTIFKNILYRQKGDYKKINFYNLIKSELYLEQSDFIFEGNNPFEIKIFNQVNSNSKIIQSLFQVNNGVSVIGFNAFDSTILFERSMMDIKNIKDYIYNFRIENGNLKFNSSIIRNSNCFNCINFSIKNAEYEGANNSIFNNNNQGRGFNFWITDNAIITTVNSLYFFDNNNNNSAFIYFNNNNYEALKPVWYSNIISTSVVLMENLEKKDSDAVIFDFSEKNINYNFTDEFNFNSDDFFTPVKDSAIFQAGISEYNSPILIPKYDFKGNLRNVPGYGIDIGAVQKSGN